MAGVERGSGDNCLMAVPVSFPREVSSGEGAAATGLSGDAASPSLGARAAGCLLRKQLNNSAEGELSPSLASDAPESPDAASPSLELSPGIHTNPSSRWFHASPANQDCRSQHLTVNSYSKPSKTRTPPTSRCAVAAGDHLQLMEDGQSWKCFAGLSDLCLWMSFRGQSGHRDVGNSPRGELLCCLRSKQPHALSAQGWGARRAAPALASP